MTPPYSATTASASAIRISDSTSTAMQKLRLEARLQVMAHTNSMMMLMTGTARTYSGRVPPMTARINQKLMNKPPNTAGRATTIRVPIQFMTETTLLLPNSLVPS